MTPHTRQRSAERDRPSRYEFSKVTVSFESDGARCAGWLYRPDRPADPPVIVMANGTGAEKSFGLGQYAERFAERGYAAFLFDYRYFGDSEGDPRRLVDPERQLADLKAAVDRVRDLDDVDGRRVILWGFSLGGGHVLQAASEDRRVRAVVAAMPMTDGVAVSNAYGWRYNLRAAVAGLRDRLGALVGRRYSVPVVGSPDEFAVLNQPGVRRAFLDQVPRDSDWENSMPAHIYNTFRSYRPVEAAENVTCPTLLIAGGRDDVVAPDLVAETAEALPDGTLLRLPIGHYDVFAPETVDRLLAHQLAFLETL
jgi:dienelactone hydrolase